MGVQKAMRGGSKMVRDQDGTDAEFLSTPEEDEDSFQEQENMEEQTAKDTMDTKEDEEGEYDLYRLERLLRLYESDKLPTLKPTVCIRKSSGPQISAPHRQ
jgi:hypothetical protein